MVVVVPSERHGRNLCEKTEFQAGNNDKAPYDDIADWYEEYRQRAGYKEGDALLADLLGKGSGWCVDVACGTGSNFEAIGATGRSVIGIDLSQEMLRRARTNDAILIRSDARELPFRTESVDTVVCTYLHSDVDDMAPVFNEIQRVLRPDGRFVYFGVHPCFTGHFIERREDSTYVIHPGYWETGWHFDSPYWGDGVRQRVGLRHATLTELINALLASGLQLEGLMEPKGGSIPWNLAITAKKSPFKE